MGTPKPNILIMLTDQHAHDALSCAGNPWLHTPHLDALAARGMRFTQAHVAYPVCVPSRTSLQYGCEPHQVMLPNHEMISCPRPQGLGAVRDGFAPRELGHVLSAAGYRCGWAGKWHVGTWGPNESLEDYADTGFQALCPISDVQVPGACAAFMQAEDKRPFCCVASFDNPHNIHEWAVDDNLPWGELAEPPPRSQLPPLPSNFAADPYEPRSISECRNLRALGYDADAWRRYRWAYYRLVERIDQSIGHVLAALDASGAANNTLIIFSSDHGEMAGEHNLAFKTVLYDASVRVPLILAGPGCPANSIRSELISNGRDIYATCCAAAGASAPNCGLADEHHGQDLRQAVQRDHLIVSARFHSGVRARLVREQRWAYMAYERGPGREQLFDCLHDPGQNVNLEEIAAFQGEKSRLREHLRRWQQSTSDMFNAGHYCHPQAKIMLPGDDYLHDQQA